MKKVLLAQDLEDLFTRNRGIFGSADSRAVFTAATNDELLAIHIREKVDLIITGLDLPGMRSEDLFGAIRENPELRAVSTIILCKDTRVYRERCGRCMANAVFTIPVDIRLLQIKAHELLHIAPRKPYRAALAVGIQGQFRDKPQPFWTENISASGMLIRSREPLAKGDAVFFSFFLHDGRHVSGYGEVTRIHPPRPSLDAFLYGVKFTNVDQDARTAIESVIGRRRR